MAEIIWSEASIAGKWPYLNLKAKIDGNKMSIKVIKRELKFSNCGFDHDPVDSMVRSQWQSTSKNCFYLAYRWLVAIIVVAIVIIALQSHLKNSNIDTFFIYLTRWGILLNMMVGIFGAILVTFWHFHLDFQSKQI